MTACSEHPHLELAPAPGDVRGALRCLQHEWRGQRRCAHCGGAMRDGSIRRVHRAIYCTTRCRVAALRARRRLEA